MPLTGYCRSVTHITPSGMFIPGGVALVTRGRKEFRFTPSKPAPFETAFLEAFAGPTGAEIVATELFFEPFVAVNDPHAPFDLCFRRIAAPTFAHRFERTAVREYRS